MAYRRYNNYRKKGSGKKYGKRKCVVVVKKYYR